MAEINLLPIDLSKARGSVKAASGLRKIIVVFSGLFLIVTVLGAILIVFLTSQVNSSLSRQTQLKQNITSLQNTEQQLLLIKDRIGKVNSVSTNRDAATIFISIDKTLSSLPTNVSVGSVEISSDKTKFTVVSKDSLGMAAFLNLVVVSGLYKSLSLTQFNFSSATGYTISLEVS